MPQIDKMAAPYVLALQYILERSALLSAAAKELMIDYTQGMSDADHQYFLSWAEHVSELCLEYYQ